MRKASAILLFAAIVVCAINCNAGTVTWGYDGDLSTNGLGFQPGWCVQLYEDVNQNGFGAGGTLACFNGGGPANSVDDTLVPLVSTVLVSGKSGLNWGTTFNAPAGALGYGDHVFTVIFSASTVSEAGVYWIADAAPFPLPAADQDADYIQNSVHNQVQGPLLDVVTISVTAGANGTISPGSEIVHWGPSPTFVITATNDYKIANVLVDGTSVGPSNSYTFSYLMSSHTISATFTPMTIAAKGTPVTWLQSYGMTNNYNAQEVADPDGDGCAMWQEYIAGTDPTNAASCFRISSLSGVDQGQPSVISWDTKTGRLYSVFSRTNLLVPPWITNVWRIPCNGSPLIYTNNDSNMPALFFRLKVEKP